MGRSKKYNENFTTGKDDKFIMLYNHMVTSDAFLNLPASAVKIYIFCRNQATSNKGRANLKQYLNENADLLGKIDQEKQEYIEEHMKGNYFVLPAKHLEEIYKVKRQNGCRALKQLQDEGFIEIVSNGKHQKKQNLYRFSDGWKSRNK